MNAPKNRLARGLSVVLGLTVALSLAAPATAHADSAPPAPPAEGRDLCLPPLPCLPIPLPIPPIPLPIPELPLPPLPIPELPIPLPGIPTAPTATKAVAIEGVPRTGKTLTAQKPTWDQGDTAVTTTYRWQRDGVDIVPSAVGLTYVVKAADVTHKLTVVATGTTTGLLGTTASTESKSEPVTALKGEAPKVIAKPKLQGSPAVGSTLTVTSGTWPDPQPETFTYQWYRTQGRSAVAIPGATGTTYQPTATDAGRYLAVLVTAATTGYESGTAVSEVAAVPQAPKLASAIRVTVVKKTIAPSQRAQLRIVLAATDGPVGGRVAIMERGRTIATRTVRPGGGTVKAPKLAPGVHFLTVVYRGDAKHRTATAAPVKVTVKKPRRR